MSDYESEVLAWREARVRRLTAELGWLSVVGKHALREGVNRVGSAPGADVPLPAGHPAEAGVILLEGGRARFDDASGSRPLDPGGPPVVLGRLRLEAVRRGDEWKVRVRDPDNPARLHFPGIPSYPFRPEWRLRARFEPYPTPRRVELAYPDGPSDAMESPGRLHFEAEGRALVLEPYLDTGTSRLYVVFRDLTSRDETYGAGRFLYAPLPQGGEGTLDFNMAYNPPCAFSPWVSCPLVPDENRLAIRIEAGEKRPK